eukprot:329677-Chlamydomonas_euryale.AAC.7
MPRAMCLLRLGRCGAQLPGNYPVHGASESVCGTCAFINVQQAGTASQRMHNNQLLHMRTKQPDKSHARRTGQASPRAAGMQGVAPRRGLATWGLAT